MTTWLFNNGTTVAIGNSSVTYNISSLSTDDTGVYYCVASIDGMMDVSDNYTLFVAPYSVVVVGNTSYSEAEQLMLTCTSEGGPQLEYSWIFNSSIIANTSTLTIDGVNTSHRGNYTCNVTNIAGDDNAMVTVYIAPYDVAVNGDTLYSEAEQLMLTCASEGGPQLEYSWIFNGSIIANTSTLTIDAVNTTHGGNYTCNVTNVAGDDNAMVTVFIAPYSVIVMGDTSYSEGDQLMLNCTSEGGPQLEYSWIFNGSIIANTSTYTLTIDGVNTSHGGNYTCNVTNVAGDDNAMVTVYIAPYSVNVTGNTSYSQGDQLMLNCTSEGGPQLEYSWIFNGNIIANTSTLTIDDVNTSHGGDYTCNVTNVAGDDNAMVTVYVAPYDVTISGMRRYPYGSSVELICASEGGPQLDFSWTFSDNITDTDNILNISNIDATSGGEYTCNVSNTAGSQTNSTTVYVGPRFIIDPEGGEVVINGSFMLNCSAEGFPRPTIVWYINDTVIRVGITSTNTSMIAVSSMLTISSAGFSDSGVYYCEAVSSEFADLNVTSSMINITVVERPVVNPPRSNVALGDSVTFTCDEFGSPPFTYFWFMRTVAGDDVLLVNETIETYNISAAQYNDTGGYFCEASNSIGVLSNSTPAVLQVRPDIVEHPVVMQSVYPGVMVNFSCRAAGFSTLNYSWFVVPSGSNTGMRIENETNTTYIIANPVYDINATGYYCIGSNNEGIAVSNTSTLTVLQPVITNITITPDPSDDNTLLHIANSSVSLTCTADGGPRIMTTWLFNDGTAVAIGNGSVTYDIPLLSTDHTGVYYCVASIDGMMDVSDNYTLFVAPYDVNANGENQYPQRSQLQLTCTSEGGPQLEYSWIFNGSIIANTSTLTIDDVNTSDGGDYTCNVTNVAGDDNDSIIVYIGVVLTTQPQDQFANVSGSVSFTCEASGSIPIAYSWLYNGSPVMNDPGHIEGADTNTLMFVNVTVTDWGLYSCLSANIVDNMTSDNATLHVSPLGTVDVTPDGTAVNHTTDNVTFTCQSMAGPNLVYSWLFNGDDPSNLSSIVVNGSELIVNNVTYLLGGTYTCVVTNDAGEGMDTSDLFVNPFITTNPISQQAMAGGNITFTCIAVAFPAPSYSWSTPINTTNFTTSVISLIIGYDSYGNFTCTVTSNGTNAVSMPALLTVSPEDSVTISPEEISTSFGSMESFSCEAQGGPNNNFVWRKQEVVIRNDSVLDFDSIIGSDGAVYQCTVTNSAGSDSLTSTLTVAPYNATITEVVVIDMVTYTCYADGGPNNSYVWLRTRDNATVSSMPELVLNNTAPLDGGDYSCNISNVAGSTTAMVTLDVATVIVVSPEPQQNITAGQPFMLTCNATGFPVPNIEWTLNGTSYTIRDPSVITITPTDGLRSNTSVITVSNATASDSGTYQCMANNEVNTVTANAIVTVQDCPDEPVNVSFSAVNSRDLIITWTEPHNNNAPIDSYNISYQNPVCLVNASIVPSDVTRTSTDEQAMITGLHPGESYTFIIIAINEICPSQPSEPAIVRTMEEAPAVAPVVSTTRSQRSISVTWVELSCQDRRGIITMYEVLYASEDFGVIVNETLNTSSGSVTSLSVSDLEEFANYTIAVRAYTSAGPGPYSDLMDVETLPDFPSGSVTGLDAVNVNATIVELSWGSVSERDQNGIILSYNVYYRQNNSISTDYIMRRNITEMRYNITGLNESEVYIFDVTANNQVGESTVNATTMIQTNESRPSDSVQSVMISNLTDDSISVVVTWDPPTDPNGIVRSYRVEFLEVSDPLSNGGRRKKNSELDTAVRNEYSNITGGSTRTNITLSGLVAYRQYNYSVFAATSVGEGPPFTGTFITREDTPLEPTNLAVNYPGVARNSTTLLVTWGRPTCDRGVLSGYELCYVESSTSSDCVNDGMRVNITGPDQLSYTINGLSINTNYTVELRGRTGAGLGNAASDVNSTDEDAPAPVTTLRVEFVPLNDIRGVYNVTWVPPSSRNGSFYQVLQYSYMSAYNIGPLYNDSVTINITDQTRDWYSFSDGLYFTDYSFVVTTVNIKYIIDNGPSELTDRSAAARPTAVRDLSAVPSSPESIFIKWNHPEYPNSQLMFYRIFYNGNPTVLQTGGSISSTGFTNGPDNIPAQMTSHNLTGLEPFTNYTILVTVRGSDREALFEVELLQRTNTTIPTDSNLPPPAESPIPPSGTVITVFLPSPGQIDSGVLELYAVVVVSGRQLNRNTPKGIINDFNGELPPPSPVNATYNVYTAAVWTKPEDVPSEFRVGVKLTTTGPDGTVYENRALQEGTTYGVFYYIRLKSDTVEAGPLILGDDFLDRRMTVPADDGGSNAGGIAAGVIVSLIVVIAIIVIVIVLVWYYRRHHDKRAIYTGEVAFSESENVVLNPVAPQPYMGTFVAIPVSEFRHHVSKMHADSDYRFSEEYGAVEPDHTPTTEATLHPSNANKNRYANITAYDHSRVRLQVVPSEPGSDYMNANYIDGYKRKNAYIATQGPVPDTFASFWRMIWELDVQTIVMLTNLEEKGRVKCHQYWPDDRVVIPGAVKVVIQEQLELAEYTVRTFSLKKSGSKEERIIKQFHYTTWPDFGVPEHPTPVLRFTRRILVSDLQDAGPLVVHCSAGVGRSGTFITLHSQLQRIAAEGTIDIFSFVRQMRYRRCHMVQTEPQYVFIHDALLEAIECGDTEVVARDLKEQYRKLSSLSADSNKRLIEEEFKRIDDSIHISVNHVTGQAPANKAKNRFANILPYDNTRCRISAVPGQEGSDYINASYVDGYLKQKAFVATQGPLPDTAAEFWRMIWELKCATIIMLVKEREGGRAKCHRYWPDTGAETFGQYQVVAHSAHEYAEYTLREFKLVDKKDNSSLPVRHFQFTAWPEGGAVPGNSGGLIDVIGQVQKWQQHSGNKPITVHCSGGSGRTGTYIAISSLLDRLKVEGVVDVFQTVRALRLQRMHMVQSLAQYEFCYKTVLEFLDSFELYSNFK